MFLLFALLIKYQRFIPSDKVRSIQAGYYKLKLIGGQGGRACQGGEASHNFSGGHGAIISGIVHLKGINQYRIVVGGSPTPTCNKKINLGSFYGEGGDSGEDTELQDGGDSGGGGGGYSLFEIKNGHLIAIAGGGSGASAFTNGASAGGRNENYMIIEDGSEIICKKTADNECFSRSRRGGYGKDSSGYPGSGGGGGAKGGYGNSWAYYDESVWQSVAKGGSSDWDENYFYEGPNVSVGIDNGATGDGSFTLESVTLCNSSCYDCEYRNESHCTSCFPGDFFFEGKCYKSCADTPKLTYPIEDKCELCPERCMFCINRTECSVCRFDQMQDFSGNCIPRPTPNPTPKPTPTMTPARTPEPIPQSTTSIAANDGHKNNLNIIDIQRNSNAKSKQTLGLVIGFIVGFLALVVTITLIIWFMKRSKRENDSSEHEMAEETVMTTTEYNSVTVDNPMYTTSTVTDQEDVFKDDFEERYTSGFFHIHENEISNSF